MAVLVTVLVTLDRITASWTRRRWLPIATLAGLGFLAGGPPSGTHLIGWALAGTVTAIALVVGYVTLLRFDMTLVPLALGVMIGVGAIARAMHGPFPGAIIGALAGLVVIGAMAWLWFRALRRVAALAIHPAI
jgi:hypothetical protein